MACPAIIRHVSTLSTFLGKPSPYKEKQNVGDEMTEIGEWGYLSEASNHRSPFTMFFWADL